jgi:hypothetical protein
VAALEPVHGHLTPEGVAWFAVHLDVNLSQPVPVGEYLPSEVEGLSIGDPVSVEGLLSAGRSTRGRHGT